MTPFGINVTENGVDPANSAAANGAAMQALLDANPGRLLLLPAGIYQFDRMLVPKGSETLLVGEGTGWYGIDPANRGTVLKFPAGVSGIEFRNLHGAGCGLRDLTVEGSEPFRSVFLADAVLPKGYAGSLAGTPPHGLAENDGIRIGANFTHLTNVQARWFGRHGFNLSNADLYVSDSDLGWANNVNLINCWAVGNRGCGYYAQGGDCNAVSTLQLRTYYSQCWGMLEESFLGNAHYSPFAHNNHEAAGADQAAIEAVWAAAGIDGGHFKSTLTTGQSVWVEPYNEGGPPMSKINGHNLMLGGTNGAGYDPADPPCYLIPLQSGLLDSYAVQGRGAAQSAGAIQVAAQLGSHDGNPFALRFWKNGDPQEYRLWHEPAGQQPGCWYLMAANNAATSALILSGAGAPIAPGNIAFPSGLHYLHAGNFIQHQAGTGPPAAGAQACGNVCWNVAPAPGSCIGWVCVVPGTPGEWAEFGEVGPAAHRQRPPGIPVARGEYP